MPLVLGIDQGRCFHVGEGLADGHPSKGTVQVVSIESTRRFHVAVVTDGGTHHYMIDDREGVQVLQNVYLSCGKRGTMEMARVLIDAPREITVRRQEAPLHG